MQEANDCFSTAIILNYSNFEIWERKGLCFFYLENYKEAIECFNKCLDIKPLYEPILAKKAKALYSLGEINEALN